MRLVILSQTPEKRRFPILESLTGVSENTWRTWWNRGGTPSGALVEGVGRAWPEFAFWLTTGLTDVEYGHRIPKMPVELDGYINNYPETTLREDRIYAAQYFKVCKEMQDADNASFEKGERQGMPQHQREILENTRQFIAKQRRLEVGVVPKELGKDHLI